MKNFLKTLILLVVAAAGTYGAVYVSTGDRAARHAAREGDAMTWLRTEFHLNTAQFAAIKQLHEEYGVVCSEHCAAILAARQRGAPATEMATLEATCVQAMTAHFQRVAALMPPGEGERYLATVLPCVTGYSHADSPTVQGRP
jgi:hypothetical protein